MFAFLDMMRVSLAQYVIVALVTMLFALFAGSNAAYSALIAGAAYAVPTSLLVLFLFVLRRFGTADSSSRAMYVLVGEVVKVLMVAAAYGLAIKFYDNLYWPAMIVSIIAVANSYLVVLFKKK